MACGRAEVLSAMLAQTLVVTCLSSHRYAPQADAEGDADAQPASPMGAPGFGSGGFPGGMPGAGNGFGGRPDASGGGQVRACALVLPVSLRGIA